MKSILIPEGYEASAELFACLFARDGWTVTLSRDGLAQPTRSGAALTTIRCS